MDSNSPARANNDIARQISSDRIAFYVKNGTKHLRCIPIHELQREAKAHASQIFADFRTLRAIVDRHETTIQKHWAKKTRSRRLALLQNAWGSDLPATHQPDFALWLEVKGKLEEAVGKNWGALILPLINKEDLVKPRTLPLLLNARARNHPGAFAAGDGEAMSLGIMWRAILVPQSPTHIMVLNDVVKDKHYGMVVSYADLDMTSNQSLRNVRCSAPTGLLILEAQERLMRFLVKSCYNILQHIPREALLSDFYPIQPAPELNPANRDVTYESLVIMADEASYRPPASLDLENIESLLAARASRAADHIWALREDPSYFADYLLELRDHHSELIQDTDHIVHPSVPPGYDDYFWNTVIQRMILEACFNLEVFSEVRDQAARLRQLQKEHAKGVSSLKVLPRPYLDALLMFYYSMAEMATRTVRQFNFIFARSPAMRDRFVASTASGTIYGMKCSPSWKSCKGDKRLAALVNALSMRISAEERLPVRFPTIVDEIGRLVKSEAKTAALLSSLTASIVGDMSIVGECMRQIDAYQPWATDNALRDAASPSLGCLGNPSHKKFDYPVDQKRNKANVDKLRRAEANLDAFWASFDKVIKPKIVSHESVLRDFLFHPRSLQRTPEWARPLGKETQNPTTLKANDPSGLHKPFSTFALGEPQTPTKRKLEPTSTPTPKVKTRGKPASDTNPQDTELPPSPEQDIQPVIRVDARALKAFRALFFEPDVNTTPGEVAWKDFLHAMASAGFEAKKLYGSAWHFQPASLDATRSIQFHEPHPKGKLSFWVARRYGRRLDRAFGWSGETFALSKE